MSFYVKLSSDGLQLTVRRDKWLLPFQQGNPSGQGSEEAAAGPALGTARQALPSAGKEDSA